MAKVYYQKARKEYRCSKCGRVIVAGERYGRIEENFARPRIVCCDCKVKRSDLTGSDYKKWLYDFQDELSENYDLQSECACDISSELEDKKSELEDSLENIPEQLRDAEAGSILQERIESLEEAISDLENLEFPDKDDEEYQTEDDEPMCEVAEELDAPIGLCVGERYSADEATLELSYCGYTLINTDEDTEQDEFDLRYRNGGNELQLHFEIGTHFDEEKYEEATSEYAGSIEDIVGNIAE